METWVARPAATRSRLANIDLRHRIFAALVAVAFLLAAQPFVASAGTSSGSISGTAFQDMNRDGLRQAGEGPFEGHRIYLDDAEGTTLGWVETDADGRFQFSGLPDGDYEVRYFAPSWWEVWEDWVPTTTGSLQPRQTVTVQNGPATADFGWRPIVTSDVLSEPITEVTGPSGLRVQSYNDVVTAQEIHDHIMAEFLVGDEAPHTRVRFAYSSSDSTRTSVTMADGQYTSYRATVYISYLRWLRNGDRALGHEYGHAWSLYYAYMVQQDRSLISFLEARGLDDDARVGTSYEWSPAEIIAEDYRQLFASENARSGGQLNNDIPRPWEVDGLEDWLRDEFTTPPSTASDGADEDDGASDDDGSEDPGSADEDDADGANSGDVEEGSHEEDQSEATATTLDLTVDTYKVRGVNHAELVWTGNASSDLDVYRDGEHITTTNGSRYVDETGSRGSPTYTYRVCEVGTDICSEPLEVRF